jgi:hypothetical protein
MLRILTGVVFGAMLLLISLNGLSATFGDVAYTVVLLVQSIVLFVFAVIAKHGMTFFAKGLTKFALRLTVFHLMRLYIMLHPDISNARVEQYRDRLVARVRGRVVRMRGMRRVMAIFGIASAAVTVFTILLLLGAMRFTYDILIGPLVGIVARTVVGKVIIAWLRAMGTLLRTHVRDRYHRTRVRYKRINMRMLRTSARRYRRLHRRKDDDVK